MNLIEFLLLIIVFILSGLDWYALAKNKTRLGYFTKPGVIGALILWVAVRSGFPAIMNTEIRNVGWVLGALVLAMTGDILLMLPTRRSRLGAVFFLLAHIAYLFSLGGVRVPPYATAPAILLAIFALIPAVQLMILIIKRIGNEMPVYVVAMYSVYILLGFTTVFAAGRTFLIREWPATLSLLSSAGALSLGVSDIILTYRFYIEENKWIRLKSRILYHLGQIGLAIGITSFYMYYLTLIQ
ncbi:MAG: hypothetical protein JXA19_03880 [Anaerolineales bacterium]|nr:hypothetical protein [Anaerolineales bacterium]